jgi:hypothetical protein
MLCNLLAVVGVLGEHTSATGGHTDLWRRVLNVLEDEGLTLQTDVINAS